MHRDILDVLSLYLSYNTRYQIIAIYSDAFLFLFVQLHADKTIRYSNNITVREYPDSYYIVTPQAARYTIYKNNSKPYLYCRGNISIFYRMNKIYVQYTNPGIGYRNGHKYELEYIFAVIFDILDVIILACEYDTIYPFRKDSYCYLQHTYLDIADEIKERYYQRNTILSRYT